MRRIIKRKEINCPVCGSNDYEVVYKKDVVYINNEEYLWPTQQVVCEKCSMLYTNPQPAFEALERYYSSYSRYGECFGSFDFRRDQVSFLVRNLPSFVKTVFEIGAFDGSLLYCVKNADYFSEHIMYYTVFSLENIFETTGFELVASERPANKNVLRFIFRKSKNNEKIDFLRGACSLLVNRLKVLAGQYSRRRKEFLSEIKKKIGGVKKVIVYGGGMHTSQIICEGLLESEKIEFIVDSNPEKWGKRLFGHQIKPPSMLENARLPVLVSSFSSQDEIVGFLKGNYPNIEVIKLYDNRTESERMVGEDFYGKDV